ncbi:hypothetical protein FB451DRAFT_685714 [Mycena latifolia]|nr:hypothetical protein FB451DRAFT_685714 [Mycena latifolia]
MLDTLHDWSCREDSGSLVLWLHGPAGSGKSAIAQSFCQKLETEGRLGGSFFFKRGHPSCGSASKLFLTLAYQLALLLPKLKHLVSQCVEDDPSIIDKTLSTQLQRLIIEPFRNSSLTRTVTFVIIIDGLDECEGHHVQQETLRSIGSSAHQSPPHLRILIASRSEPHINEVFRGPCLDGFHRHFNIQQSFKDIRIYLLDEFARIHREHHETMAMIAIPWPSPKVIEHLVEKSSGYFIYASTVIKFIDDRNFRQQIVSRLSRASRNWILEHRMGPWISCTHKSSMMLLFGRNLREF